jgi:hypothetical protein
MTMYLCQFLQDFVGSMLYQIPLDMQDDPCPDSNETKDFEVADEQELFDAFIAGLSKKGTLTLAACCN